MSVRPNTFYLVVCEGDSEVAYIQQLNRLASESGWDIIFQAKHAGGGTFASLRKACRDARAKHTYVMTDRDLYERNDKGFRDSFEREREKLPTFLFQYHNFEDFLLLHFPSEIVAAWREFAQEHLRKPFHSKSYGPLFQTFVARHPEVLSPLRNYRKGDFPFPCLTVELLRTLFANNTKDGLPRSDFATFLQSLLLQKA